MEQPHLSHPFLRRLEKGVVLADGAMGTLLYDRGITFDRSFDLLNLQEPALVQSIHRDYIRAGAELIETNTFGASRIRLAAHGESTDAPRGTITREEALEAYVEQVEGLVEGGVDLLIIETQTDLEEMKLAIQAVRKVTDLPLVAEMTFAEDERTLYGAYPEDLARAAQSLGVNVLGANCSVGPQKLLEIVQRLRRRTELPISVMPNAGLPRFVDGRFVYVSSPE